MAKFPLACTIPFFITMTIYIFLPQITYSQAPFITTWKTDNPGPSDNNQILIPGTGQNYTIDWVEVGNPGNNGSLTGNDFTTVTFPFPGTYQVSISGNFERIQFGQSFDNSYGDPKKLLSIDQWGDIEWLNFERAFSFCENLTYSATDNPNMENILSTGFMFFNCFEFDGDISDWDVSNVTHMSYMFMNAQNFNSDISNWDVSNVKFMRYMFNGAESFDQNLGSWDIQNVETVEHMLELTGLSCENYSATLEGWASLPSLISGRILHANELEYSILGSIARNTIEQNFGWNFEGDAFDPECGCVPFEAEIIGSNIVNCSNEEIKLTASVSNITDYEMEWFSPDGNITGEFDVDTIVLDSGGTYFVTVTDQNTLCFEEDSIVILEDFEIPMVEIEEPGVLNCNFQNIWISAVNQGQNPEFSFFWTSEDGQILSSVDSKSVLVGADAWYYLEVTNELNGCGAVDSVFVEEDVEKPMVEIEKSSVFGCEQTSVWLDGIISGPAGELSLFWSTAEGEILSDPDSNAINVNEEGWYFIEVVNQQNGCIGGDSILVVKEMETPDVIIDSTSDLNCINLTVWIDGSLSSQGPEFHYHWFTNNGNLLSRTDSNKVEVNEPGWYFLEVYNNWNGCAGIDSLLINEDSKSPDIEFGTVEDLSCNQLSVWIELSTSSQAQEYNYHWSTINGNILSALDSPAIEVNVTGWYYLQVFNEFNGCMAIDSVFVSGDFGLPDVLIEVGEIIGCESFSVWLDGSSSSQGSEYLYNWFTNDGNILTIEDSIAVEVDAGGWYYLEVIDTLNECVGIDSIFVPGGVGLPEVLIEVGEIIGCESFSVWLDGSSSSQGSEYLYNWFTNDGNILTIEDSIAIEVDAGGWYYLEVIDTLNECVGIDSIFVPGGVGLPEVLIEVGEIIGCEGFSVWVDASSSSQGPQYSYEWSTAGGNIVTSIDSTAIEVNVSGWYFLEITNLDNGCTALDSVEIELELSDVELFATAQSSSCAGGELQLTAEPAGLDSYEWSGPSGFISNERNPLIENAGVEYAGTYELVATLGECEYQTEVEVNIFPLPEFDFVVDSIVCQGEPGFIEITNVSGGQPPYTYSFTQAGDFSNNPLAGPLSPGVYLLRVRDARGCTNEDIPSVVLQDGPPCDQDCAYDLRDIYLEINRYDRQTVNVLECNQLFAPYFLSSVSAGSDLIAGLEFDGNGNISFSVTGNFVDVLPIRYRICHPSCDNCAEATIYLSNRQLQDIVQTSVITPDQPTNRFLQFSAEPVEGSELWIYNRWGDQVFHSRNYQNDWDAEGYPGGVYFYVFRVYGLTIKSSLTVIR